MSDLKTQKTKASVAAYLNAIEDDQQRKDAKTIAKIMKEVTRTKPAMWGESIVGYGQYTYRYASGRSGDWPLTGFSPRKGNFSIYIMDGFKERAALLKKLGKHKTGRSCLYVKRLEDVDVDVLRKLIKVSFESKAKESA